jgi:hypothetical protein
MRGGPVRARPGFTPLPNELLALALSDLTAEQFRILVGLFYEAEFKREGTTSPDGRWRVGFGQALTSYQSVSARYGVSVHVVERALRRFGALGVDVRRAEAATPPATSPATPPATSPATPPTVVDFGKWAAFLGSAREAATPPATSPATPPATSAEIIQHRNTENQNTKPEAQHAPSALAPAQPPPAERAPEPDSPVVLELPCVGKGPKAFAVTERHVAEWREAFPGVDVTEQIRRARVWLDANPTKRKTQRGAPAFLVRWLSNAQDGGRASSSPASRSRTAEPRDVRYGVAVPRPPSAFRDGEVDTGTGERVAALGPIAPHGRPAPSAPDQPRDWAAILKRCARTGSDAFHRDIAQVSGEIRGHQLFVFVTDPYRATRMRELWTEPLEAVAGEVLGTAVGVVVEGPRLAAAGGGA